MNLEKERLFLIIVLRHLVLEEPLPSTEREALKTLDEAKLVEMAISGGVGGFLTQALKNLNLFQNLSEASRKKLNQEFKLCAEHFKARLRQFEVLEMILSEQDFSVIPLKGAALLRLIYNNLPFRKMADIDVLIRKQDAEQILSVLFKKGFRRTSAMTCRNRWHRAILNRLNAPLASIEHEDLGRQSLIYHGFNLDIHQNLRYEINGESVMIDVNKIWQRGNLDHAQFALHLLIHASERSDPKLVQLFDLSLYMRHFKLSPEMLELEFAPQWREDTKLYLKQVLFAVRAWFGTISEGNFTLTEPETAVFRDFLLYKTPKEGQPEAPTSGLSVIKYIPSWHDKLLFILGYFVPEKNYYWEEDVIRVYLKHWKGLANRISRVLKGPK